MSQSCQRARTLGKFSRQTLIARISCHLHIFIYITHLTKIPTWKLFTLTPIEKIKSRKKALGKENEKTGSKKKEKAPHCQGKKKKTLLKATKALGLGKRLRQSSASAEDPERSNILGASSLKIKVNVSAGCEQDSHVFGVFVCVR